MLFIDEGMFGKALLTTVPIADGNAPAVRVARPAEDGLPRPAQPHDHGRRHDAIKMVKANKGIDLKMLALALPDDPKTFEQRAPR